MVPLPFKFMKITCPTCKKKTDYDLENDFRPFCSNKCKLIDLGSWAAEEFSIPGSSIQGEDDEK